MTIIVEDGTGLDNAESYSSVAEADAYFTKRGVVRWDDATTQQKEIALINATETIDLLFGLVFIGVKLKETQALQFPRLAQQNYARPFGSGAYSGYYGGMQRSSIVLGILPTVSIGIETDLKRATFEFAVRSLDKSLLPDVSSADVSIKSISKELAGALKKDIVYSDKKQHQLDPVVFRVPLKYLSKYIVNKRNTVVRG